MKAYRDGHTAGKLLENAVKVYKSHRTILYIIHVNFSNYMMHEGCLFVLGKYYRVPLKYYLN